MPSWTHTINLATVFHDEGQTFEQLRDAIVTHIKRSTAYIDEFDDVVDAIVEALAQTCNTGEFNELWDEFYDWADDNRVWVSTQ